MGHPSPTSFEQLEADAQLFARGLVKRNACPCCVSRALLFAAMELAHKTDGVPALRATMAALLEADEPDETTAAMVPHH